METFGKVSVGRVRALGAKGSDIINLGADYPSPKQVNLFNYSSINHKKLKVTCSATCQGPG